MSEDLQDLLALTDGAGVEPAPSVLTEDSSSSLPEASETALVLDQWSLRKGAEWSCLFDELNNQESADLRSTFYDPEPVLSERCIDPFRQEFVRSLLENPDVQATREFTVLNDEFSQLAFTRTAKEYLSALEEQEKHKPAPPPPGSPPTGDGEDGLDPSSMARAMAAAARASTDVRKETEAMQAAAGMGGLCDPTTMDAKKIAEIYRRVRGDAKLRRVSELAGRLRLVARAQQRRKTSHGRDDLVGVTLGNSIPHLVPTELMALVDEDLEWDAIRRLAERSALCRDWQGIEPVGKGPIVVTVDESGSMQGQKEETAKALALTLAWLAVQQKRWCGLVAYSGNSGHRLLVIDPAKPVDTTALLDWVSKYIGGGCSRDVPVVELPDYWKQMGPPLKATDIVVITDALVHFSKAEMDTFNGWRKSVEARVTGLIIQDQPGDLTRVCDEVFRVPAITPDNEAVETVLGI